MTKARSGSAAKLPARIPHRFRFFPGPRLFRARKGLSQLANRALKVMRNTSGRTLTFCRAFSARPEIEKKARAEPQRISRQLMALTYSSPYRLQAAARRPTPAARQPFHGFHLASFPR